MTLQKIIELNRIKDKNEMRSDDTVDLHPRITKFYEKWAGHLYYKSQGSHPDILDKDDPRYKEEYGER
jgi:hypothetical protein